MTVLRFAVVAGAAFAWFGAGGASAQPRAGPPPPAPGDPTVRWFAMGAPLSGGVKLPTVEIFGWNGREWLSTRPRGFNIGDRIRATGRIGQGPFETLDTGCDVVDIQEAMIIDLRPRAEGEFRFRMHPAPTVRVTVQDGEGRVFHRYVARDQIALQRWRYPAALLPRGGEK